jgi:hypothetical protein
MTNQDLKDTNSDLNHITTQTAGHGFRHKVCEQKKYYRSNENCVCELHGNVCDQYHIINCQKRMRPLNDYCREI